MRPLPSRRGTYSAPDRIVGEKVEGWEGIVYVILLCMAVAMLGMMVASLQGCATTPGLVPSLGGKTSVEREFIDTDGTSWREEYHGPAGVQVAGESNIKYVWRGDGSGNFEIGGSTQADTQGQAQLMGQIAAINGMMFKSFFDALPAILKELLPLLNPAAPALDVVEP